jgi:hypothetical protein
MTTVTIIDNTNKRNTVTIADMVIGQIGRIINNGKIFMKMQGNSFSGMLLSDFEEGKPSVYHPETAVEILDVELKVIIGGESK